MRRDYPILGVFVVSRFATPSASRTTRKDYPYAAALPFLNLSGYRISISLTVPKNRASASAISGDGRCRPVSIRDRLALVNPTVWATSFNVMPASRRACLRGVMRPSVVTSHVTFKPISVTPGDLPCEGRGNIYMLMITSAKLGKAIRRIRESQHKTAEDLAEVIGVSKVEMTRKERGLSPFSADQLEKLAKDLGMSLSGLCREIETPHTDRTLELVAVFNALPPEVQDAILTSARAALPKPRRKSSPAA